MNLEDTLNQHQQQGRLDSSGAFEVDWSSASRVLGQPGQIYRPLLQFIQGLVALTEAGRRPCPGTLLELVYTDRQFTLTLVNAPCEPDWQKLGGDLTQLALKESRAALGLLAGALLTLQNLKPVILRLSGGRGQVAWIGPQRAGEAGSLVLCVEFPQGSESLKESLDDSRWRQSLDFCPLPIRIQGNLLTDESWSFGEDIVEVLALAEGDQDGLGGRLWGHPTQHLGPYDQSWQRDSRGGIGPPVRALLESPRGEPLSRQSLPRISASLRFSLSVRQPTCLIIPVRFGVRLTRPVDLAPAPGEPASVLVVAADRLPCDLNGELLDNEEVRAWFEELAVLRRELLTRVVERLEETSATTDDRDKIWLAPQKKSLAQTFKRLSAGLANWASGPRKHARLLRSQPAFRLFRDGIIQFVREPVSAALKPETFVLMLVGLLQEVGGRRLFACCCDERNQSGRLRLLLERPNRDQQNLSSELLQPLLAHRPSTLVALGVADLDGEGNPTSHRDLLGTSRFPPLSSADWEKSSPARLYLPALLIQIEAHWTSLGYGPSEGYEITLAASPAQPLRLPEPSWNQDWAEELLRGGLLPGQIEQALAEALRSSSRRLDCLVTTTGLSEPQLLKALAVAHGFAYLEELPSRISLDIVHLVPDHLARRYGLIPLEGDQQEVGLAMVDPLDVHALDDIRLITGIQQFKVFLAPAAVIQAARDRAWSEWKSPPVGEFLNQADARDQLESWVRSLTST